MWQNRNNDPAGAAKGMNYICTMQKEPFKVVWLDNDKLLAKFGG